MQRARMLSSAERNLAASASCASVAEGATVLPLVLVAVALPVLGLILETGSRIESDPINWANQSSVAVDLSGVIDLAADFRIKDKAVFEKWYKIEHTCPDLLEEAAYGLGTTRWEAILRVMLPAASTGIFGALGLDTSQPIARGTL